MLKEQAIAKNEGEALKALLVGEMRAREFGRNHYRSEARKERAKEEEQHPAGTNQDCQRIEPRATEQVSKVVTRHTQENFLTRLATGCQALPLVQKGTALQNRGKFSQAMSPAT